MIYVFDRAENIVGKGEQHFLLFPQCFLQLSFSRSLKVVIVWKRVNTPAKALTETVVQTKCFCCMNVIISMKQTIARSFVYI